MAVILVFVCFFEGDKHAVPVNTNLPLLQQFHAYLNARPQIMYNSQVVKPFHTAADLGIMDEGLLDGFYPVDKNRANSELTSHIRECGFNGDNCVYLTPDIAMWSSY